MNGTTSKLRSSLCFTSFFESLNWNGKPTQAHTHTHSRARTQDAMGFLTPGTIRKHRRPRAKGRMPLDGTAAAGRTRCATGHDYFRRPKSNYGRDYKFCSRSFARSRYSTVGWWVEETLMIRWRKRVPGSVVRMETLHTKRV